MAQEDRNILSSLPVRGFHYVVCLPSAYQRRRTENVRPLKYRAARRFLREPLVSARAKNAWNRGNQLHSARKSASIGARYSKKRTQSLITHAIKSATRINH